MKNLKKLNKRTLLGIMMIFGFLLIASVQVSAQIESLADVENVLDQQDQPLKNIADRLTNWILIGGGVIAMLIALNNKEHARAAMIGYFAVIIFWLIIKALFF